MHLWPSDLPLLQNFLHGPHILLFDLLTRDFGIPLARGDLAMPQEVADRDDLGPVFQEVRGKGMPQAMATRRDPRGFGVALHLLLDRFDREGLLGAFAVPKDIALRPCPRMLRQTLLDTGHRIGRHIHAPIFAPFALHDMQGLLLPIDLLQLELRPPRRPAGHSGASPETARGPSDGRSGQRAAGPAPGRGLWAGGARAGQSDWA